MYCLTEDARLNCDHQSGHVNMIATQNLVTIDGRRTLVERDPEGREINGCPWTGPGGQLPCRTTLAVEQGYSALLRVDGRRVCLDTVRGLTNAIPPGVFHYFVFDPGQHLVSEQR
jgi:hypothetical protein